MCSTCSLFGVVIVQLHDNILRITLSTKRKRHIIRVHKNLRTDNIAVSNSGHYYMGPTILPLVEVTPISEVKS